MQYPTPLSNVSLILIKAMIHANIISFGQVPQAVFYYCLLIYEHSFSVSSYFIILRKDGMLNNRMHPDTQG